MISILLITVNYKDSNPTQDLINSILNCKINKYIKIVIIDNESSNFSFSSLKSITKNTNLDIEIIRSSINNYYWGGIQLGLDKFYQNKKDFDWIIACNNDIEFNDHSFFEKLYDLKESSSSIIAPQIISSLTSKDLNPFMIKPISFYYEIYYKIYYHFFLTAKIVHKFGQLIQFIKKKMINNKLLTNEIYAAHGSCIIFKNDFFIKGGYLETGFTMYGEEISTAEIAKKTDSKISYLPKLSLIHNEHQSTKKSSLKENFLHSKKTYYYLKKKYRR